MNFIQINTKYKKSINFEQILSKLSDDERVGNFVAESINILQKFCN